MSIVRDNLLSRKGYTPYCGNFDCRFHMPRTRFDGKQFACPCGWRSEFEADFIDEYLEKEPQSTSSQDNVCPKCSGALGFDRYKHSCHCKGK